MPREREKQTQSQRGGGAKLKGIDLIGEDLLQIILSTLPALSFASAALVSRSWNLVCNRILSRPKLSTALSLNPSLQTAVKEVLDKVLSEPIRPHFAIAYVGPKFCLHATHKLITEKLGATTPVITSDSYGIIGRDVIANEFKEVQWDTIDDEDLDAQVDTSTHVTRGIVLTIGFLPGLKVDAVPLLCPVGKEKPKSEMPREREKQTQSQRGGGAKLKGIDLIGEDLLQIILSTLPALSFASAALVSRSWNLVCNRILSRPKLSTALSLNPSLQTAVKEVLDKVLSEPIRPHFAIAYVGPKFCLHATHKLITEKLGATTPVITSDSYGIIGRDVIANEFKEVQWDTIDDEDLDAQVDTSTLVTRGIVLTVGFLPGLKVDAVPLLCPVGGHRVAMVDEFVMDIRLRSEMFSGCRSPAGVIMFGGHGIDMSSVLNKMDYAMSMETFIVGGENGLFLYRDKGDFRNPRKPGHISAAVALLFARDRNKPHGIGKTEFHVTLSTGVSPIGLTHKAVSVREKRDSNTTWITARREGRREILDGQTILNDISDEMGDHAEDPSLYIGVIKRRKFAIELENARWITSMTFHEVLGGDQEYLFVNGVGIKTGDTFRFYQSDSNSALSSCRDVSENFRRLKQDCNPKSSHSSDDKREVFGGIMLSCCGRGESFFERPNVDSSPFLENFPRIPLAGAFCGGEIRRGSLSSYSQEARESAVQSCLHVFSTVYLVMSYTPVLPEH